MGFIEDIQRRKKYGELIVRTKERVLMRFTMQQLTAFYTVYVDPTLTSSGKRPVDEISVLTLAQDFIQKNGNQRKSMIDKLEQAVSLEEIFSYAKKIKVDVADIAAEYEEQKARL